MEVIVNGENWEAHVVIFELIFMPTRLNFGTVFFTLDFHFLLLGRKETRRRRCIELASSFDESNGHPFVNSQDKIVWAEC